MRSKDAIKQYIKEAAQQSCSGKKNEFTQLVHDAIRTRAALKTILKKLAQLSKERSRSQASCSTAVQKLDDFWTKRGGTASKKGGTGRERKCKHIKAGEHNNEQS